MRFSLICPIAIAVGCAVAAGAASAQSADQPAPVSRTSDYTLTWSNSAFGNASALYAPSYALPASAAFSDGSFLINSVVSNAQNWSYISGGGVTVTSSTPPGPPYTPPITETFSGNGQSGFYGWQYNTAAGANGSGLPITFGTLGGHTTLNFDVGGSDSTVYSPGIGYYVFVYLPGDWTVAGTSPGDHIFNSVGSGFSTPTFTYSGGVTTVETFDTNFSGGGPDLNFTLVGAASTVPEPSTWAMMTLGFVGLGFAGWRRARSTT